MTAFGEDLEQLLARAERQQRELTDLRAELRTVQETVRSRDRVLSATVGADGQLVSLKFHTTEYQAMTPTQLATLVTDTIGKAQAAVVRTIQERTRPVLADQPWATPAGADRGSGTARVLSDLFDEILDRKGPTP